MIREVFKLVDAGVLRVGICSCTDYYVGKIAGRRITVRRFADGPLPEPLSFRFQEAIIPDDQGREAIRLIRAHFFLDVHKEERHFDVRLGCNDFQSSGQGTIDLVFIGGSLRLGHPMPDGSWSRRGSLPHAPEVRARIRETLSYFQSRRFFAWLGRVTPEGWEPPCQLKG